MATLKEILICFFGEGDERTKLIIFFIATMILMFGLTALCGLLGLQSNTECIRYETRAVMMGKGLGSTRVCVESREIYP
jgi:hypothetical protein